MANMTPSFNNTTRTNNSNNINNNSNKSPRDSPSNPTTSNSSSNSTVPSDSETPSDTESGKCIQRSPPLQRSTRIPVPVTPKANCACTKIGAMQLFHEMKQEFATVPDHIVCEYVMNNCHNRPALINDLKREAENFPGSVQAYPQALRNKNHSKKSSIMSPPSPHPSVAQRASAVAAAIANAPGGMPPIYSQSSSNSSIYEPNEKLMTPTTPSSSPTTTKSEVTLSNSNSSNNSTSKHSNSDNNETSDTYRIVNNSCELIRPKVPQRPNTLNIAQVPSPTFSNIFHNSIGGPTRVAPPPPSHIPPRLLQHPPSASPQQPPPPPPPSRQSIVPTLLTSHSTSQQPPHQPQQQLITTIDSADIVHRQLLCKQRLSVELENGRQRLFQMQREINNLRAPIPPGGASQLIDEIQRLRISCKQMVQEVEEAGPYLIGETNEAFYSNIYTGQPLPRPPRPPRPPPPRNISTSNSTTTTTSPATPLVTVNNSYNSSPSNNSISNNSNNNHIIDDLTTNQDGGGQPWFCNMCTFQNHPLLNKCEQCEMPLLTTSGTVPTRNATSTQSLTALASPPSVRLYQHIPYQQQSAPPVIHNPFQYQPANVVVTANNTTTTNNGCVTWL